LLFFSSNATATPGLYPLSLHDALPILRRAEDAATTAPRAAPGCCRKQRGSREKRRVGQIVREYRGGVGAIVRACAGAANTRGLRDRKSTRLNSSHVSNSYAVFCLKKKR